MTTDNDYTDPDFVLGAVLAQVEDLEPQQRVVVLADALTTALAAAKAA